MNVTIASSRGIVKVPIESDALVTAKLKQPSVRSPFIGVTLRGILGIRPVNTYFTIEQYHNQMYGVTCQKGDFSVERYGPPIPASSYNSLVPEMDMIFVSFKDHNYYIFDTSLLDKFREMIERR